MMTDIPDMTSIELYSNETEALWVNVWAEIKNGKLTVQPPTTYQAEKFPL